MSGLPASTAGSPRSSAKWGVPLPKSESRVDFEFEFEFGLATWGREGLAAGLGPRLESEEQEEETRSMEQERRRPVAVYQSGMSTCAVVKKYRFQGRKLGKNQFTISTFRLGLCISGLTRMSHSVMRQPAHSSQARGLMGLAVAPPMAARHWPL